MLSSRLFGLKLLSLFAMLIAISAPAIAHAQDEKSDKKAEKKSEKPIKKEVAHIELTGEYKEGPKLPGLFGEVTETLDDVLARFHKAAGDGGIDAVVVKIDSPSIGWGKLNEIREAILEVRAKGKPVIATLDSAMLPHYLIATACDKIVMPESGMLLVTGIRAEVSFYKNLFDKLDVEPDILRVGKYKSAAEPYSRTEMSEPFREEMELLLDDLYGQALSMIAESSNLKTEEIEKLIDAGPHSATDAAKAGLIDVTAYDNELEGIVKQTLIERDDQLAKIDELKVVKKYGKKKIDTDFSGLNGLIKMMALLTGQDAGTRKSYRPKVAVIYATGPIMTGKSKADLFGSETLGSDTFVKAVKTAADDDTVKAIVVRVNSPGGSALASDLMWHALEEVDKPIVISMGDVAASGGYYISMGANKIFAEPGTLTGSIGVVGGKLGIEGLMNKVGITTSIVSRGENSGAFSILEPFSESERVAMTKMLNETYEQFTTKAAAGRSMDVKELEKLARGRVYTGAMAKDVGLVDELGTLEDAVEAATQLAIKSGALKEDEADRVELLKLPKAKSPFEALFGPLNDEARTQAVVKGATEQLAPEIKDAIQGVGVINLLAKEPVLTVMPYQVRMR
ncbi:signal peptide peptidase SppA [Calycomorphotria hydatis]|uniref:Protease 4 n=1 Tax=Calycomorphotria hydatis TaxID=2528027 RepID=A0A517TEP6_9PLAN|nr:signal peptide peptidase SppA [Calycomorphotria hydatis]QDT66847.1 Protease 4 [Calycomorphotria hydatis]